MNPHDATHKLLSAWHEWYFKKHWRKGWMVYHLHEWFVYKDTVFKFNLNNLEPIGD